MWDDTSHVAFHALLKEIGEYVLLHWTEVSESVRVWMFVPAAGSGCACDS